MIRAIIFERYKKVLIAACLLVIGVGVFNALTENKQWKMIYHEPHAKENFEKIALESPIGMKKRKKMFTILLITNFKKLNWNFITPIQAVSKHLKPQIILRKLFIIQIFQPILMVLYCYSFPY